MSSGRAIYIIFFFNIIFTTIYFIKIYSYPNSTIKPDLLAALYAQRTPKPTPKAGIWRIWEETRICRVRGSSQPEEVTEQSWKAIIFALQFSILSTFHFGWRDLSVGNWIARMQPREYTMRATGWVRTVSGLQSLISVYLLAISVLTYFGRPFG